MTEWGLDPLYSSYRKMFVKHILSSVQVTEATGFFHLSLYSRPISKVEVVGIITHIEVQRARITYKVDDGTGVIRCVKFISPDNESVEGEAIRSSIIAAGTLVSAKGILTLSETNVDDFGLCVQLSIFESIDEPNMEVFHWVTTMTLHNTCYSSIPPPQPLKQAYLPAPQYPKYS